MIKDDTVSELLKMCRGKSGIIIQSERHKGGQLNG